MHGMSRGKRVVRFARCFDPLPVTTDHDPVRASSVHYSLHNLRDDHGTPYRCSQMVRHGTLPGIPPREIIHAAVASVPRTRPSAAHVALLAASWMTGLVCWAADFATEL